MPTDTRHSRDRLGHRPGATGGRRELDLSFLEEPPGEATADLVVHASGRPEGLRSALAVAGVEATIVEVSWYGSQSVPLPLGEAFPLSPADAQKQPGWSLAP